MQIELVPTQSLIEELMNRFDHVVISGIIDGGDPKRFTHKGNSRTCQGLATGLTFQIQNTATTELTLNNPARVRCNAPNGTISSKGCGPSAAKNTP